MNLKLKIALAVFLSPLAIGVTDVTVQKVTDGCRFPSGCGFVRPGPIIPLARPVLCPIDTVTARAISIFSAGDVEDYANTRYHICHRSGESVSTAILLDFMGIKHTYSSRY